MPFTINALTPLEFSFEKRLESIKIYHASKFPHPVITGAVGVVFRTTTQSIDELVVPALRATRNATGILTVGTFVDTWVNAPSLYPYFTADPDSRWTSHTAYDAYELECPVVVDDPAFAVRYCLALL